MYPLNQSKLIENKFDYLQGQQNRHDKDLISFDSLFTVLCT